MRLTRGGSLWNDESALTACAISRGALCKAAIRAHNLPLAADTESPIFFVKVGAPPVGANLMTRMMNEGYYLNLGVFPAVAWRDTGMRFAVNLHQSFEDISAMVAALAYHLPLARKDEFSVRGVLKNLLNVGHTAAPEPVEVEV